MRIIPVSDLHVHHEDKNNVKIQRRVTPLVSEASLPDDVVVITGDIVDDGDGEQYRKALVMLKVIRARVLVLPGNHDMGFLGTAYEEESAKAFDLFAEKFGEGPFIHKAPQTIKIGNVLFILLNSCLQTESPFDLFCGEIGGQQLFQLDRILNIPENKELVKIVALHHHPVWQSDPTMRLLDADKFIRTIYGRVDIVLNGHRHVHNVYKNVGGCKFILAAGALYEENTCDEIVIEGGNITVRDVRLLTKGVL